MKHPFAGVTILEFGTGAAIAYAGKLLRDLGSTVVKIEPPAGDPARRHGPFPDDVADTEASGLFSYLNAGKCSVVVDPSHQSGRAQLRTLFAAGHVLLHAERDPRCAQWELRPEDLARAFPRCAVVAVTPYGLTGPWRDLPAEDLTLQAIGGISLGIGLPGRAPLKLPGDQSSYQAGLAAAIAGAGALLSQRGALIDVAAAAVWAAFYSGVEVANAHFGRQKKPRAGHRVSRQPYPRTTYRCIDGYFAIQCGESRHWQIFLRMIGREELARHPLLVNRFKANDEHGDACDALIEPWFLSRTKQEILRQCLEHKIPGAPVYDLREVVEHPHLRARRYFVDIPTKRGPVSMPGHPFAGLAGAENGARAPRLGEHNPQMSTFAAGDAHDGAPIAAAAAVRPLSGLRVIDFGWVWAGAVPGHVLADMGAEVIKVESASPLDYMRQGRPIIGTEKDPEQNPMFHNVNRGKLSLRISLDRPEAREILKDLVAISDVVIENFSPGVMKKFGLSYAQLSAVRPDLVMCSMSAAGQQGPLAGIRTYATMIAGLSGLDSLVGYPGERVLGSQSSYADPNASLHATFAILAALWRRRRTAEGAYIDLSQWESAVNVMGEQVADYALNGRVPATCGTCHAHSAPYGNYPAAGDDRWIAIAVESDAQWQGLKHVLDDPAWMALEKFSSSSLRHMNRDDLDIHLGDETRKHDAEVLAHRLLAAGVPAGPLLDARSIANYPLFRERELFEMMKHPVLEAVPVYRLPWKIGGKAVALTRRAPLLGEHNAHVLRTLLRYPDEHVRKLQDSGVFN